MSKQTDVDLVICLQGNGIDRADTAGCNGKGWTEGVCYTPNTIDRPAVVYDARGNGDGDVCPTITGNHKNRITDYTAIAVGTFQNTGQGWWNESDVAATVRTPCGGDSVKANLVAVMESGQPNAGIGYDLCPTLNASHEQPLIAAVDCRNGTENPDVNGALQAHQAVGSSLNLNNVVRQKYIVRRLTPLEAERLQGFPDGWTDIGEYIDTNGKRKQSSDSARYKALGNSIALPFWQWLLGNISAQYDRPATLGSLFDGIGGFCLCWERINGKGSARWASEIEEFPIAVTKYHFGEQEAHQ